MSWRVCYLEVDVLEALLHLEVTLWLMFWRLTLYLEDDAWMLR